MAPNLPLQLSLQSRHVGHVAVVRCRGRIVAGEELQSLRRELEKLTQKTKNIILHLEEVSYLDSAGLGGVVRHLGVLRAAHGDLKLCQVSPFVLKVLQVTNLHSVFDTHNSEGEAVEAFSERPRSLNEAFGTAKTKVLCVDASSDVLAYLSALLNRSGYEVISTRMVSDAVTLLKASRPGIVVLGPGIHADERVLEMLRRVDSEVQLLLLPAGFSTAEASQAGLDLVERIRTLHKP